MHRNDEVGIPAKDLAFFAVLLVFMGLAFLIRSRANPLPVLSRMWSWVATQLGLVFVVGCLLLALLAWLGRWVGFRQVVEGVKVVALIVFGSLFLMMTGAVLGLILRSALLDP